MRYEAAKQFYEREGHLQVPRKHVERIVSEDQEEQELRVGAWVRKRRSRAAALTPADGAAVRDRDALVVPTGAAVCRAGLLPGPPPAGDADEFCGVRPSNSLQA